MAATAVHLGVARSAIEAEIAARPALVIADARVLGAHPLRIEAPLLSIEGGEPSKTLAALERVLRRAAGEGCDRQATFVAVGGGSIGDLAGFAASVYLRGVRYVQVPTTLLAMLDSSVGGKTAVNLPEGKNLVGTFWPAQLVLMDPAFVATLSEPEYRSGLGEALKIGIGLSAPLFDLLERERAAVLRRDPGALAAMLELALAAKIAVVESDPRENGPRRLLNLGHTLGHALEAHGAGALPHGVAVARGLHFALELANERGTIAAGAAGRCRALLAAYGFAATPLPPAAALAPFVARDKKAQDGGLHVVLPTGIGSSQTCHLPLEAIIARLR
jgi:3-dehydroquinate synthase